MADIDPRSNILHRWGWWILDLLRGRCLCVSNISPIFVWITNMIKLGLLFWTPSKCEMEMGNLDGYSAISQLTLASSFYLSKGLFYRLYFLSFIFSCLDFIGDRNPPYLFNFFFFYLSTKCWTSCNNWAITCMLHVQHAFSTETSL